MSMSPVLHAETDETSGDNTITTMVGAGYQHLPTWIGSRNTRYQAIPYVLFDWPNHVTFSTVDGLNVDLIGDKQLHGGLYANYMWGRDRKDLSRRLSRIVHSLSPRLHAGGYLEYQVNKPFSFGGNLSHDTQGAGAYLDLYADHDLPSIGYLEHSVEVQWQAMNGAAMRRFFGVRRMQAQKINTQHWDPTGGSQQISFSYNAYMPTSQHTGFVLGLEYTRLLGSARNSPLVKRFGTPNQFATSLAFVYKL
ncbi:MipA/OmpV family protein [Dyella subtropica]|uniref:MipA/OmpV family protein n=1 Tax=Dyella subtropica TaxID=2992127 RepID=UPI002253484B|nr:MipA/OmpV family protein [Dyella subtropica]